MTATEEYTKAYAVVYCKIKQTLEEYDLNGDISPQANMYDDLGLGPLDCVMLATDLEDRYGLVFNDDDLAQFALFEFESQTIDWLVVFILRKTHAALPALD